MDSQKLFRKLVSGSSNIRFSDLQKVVEAFGFKLSRISGDHHIYSHADVPKIINLQNVKGEAKPYQIKQMLKIIEKYNLKMEDI